MIKRITGIVGWIGVVAVAAAVAIWVGKPAWEAAVRPMAFVSLACLLVYVIGEWREITRAFRRRQARLGTAAVSAILVALGIFVAVNYIASRENKRWDLTAAGTYSLSDQTRKILSELDAPLKMTAYAVPGDDTERFRLSLPEYEYVSKKVTVEYVDPVKNPIRARQQDVQTSGTIVLEYKGRTEKVVSTSEQDIVNAVIKVTTGEQKKVYFVQGHGEKDTAKSDSSGYSAIASVLGKENYTVDRLVLAQQTDVPADAAVLVVAGPTMDYLQVEVDQLQRYLQKGGKLLLMLDPPDKADSPPLTHLLDLAREWDVQVNNDIIFDLSGIGQLFGANEAAPVAAPPYPSFPIVEGFRYLTAFPLARSVTAIAGGINGHNAQVFIQTGARSWATDAVRALKSTGGVKLDEKNDRRGPIAIGAAVSAPATEAPAAPARTENPRKPETRAVVMGDSDFVANNAIGTQGNKDLFMNTISWLAQQENLISIRPKDVGDSRLTLTAADYRALWLLALPIIPGLIVAAGIYTWWRRR